jgi:tRNA pseudouridine38-40 synthase
MPLSSPAAFQTASRSPWSFVRNLPSCKRLPSARQTFLVEFCYRGAAFHGVQPQQGRRTVGGELLAQVEAAFGQTPLGLSFAARTDAGVSARQNYASFHFRGLPEPSACVARWSTTMSGPDLALLRVQQVPEPLQARHAAERKRYAYALLEPNTQNPSADIPRWQLAAELDLELMKSAGRALLGEHDFSAFRAKSCSAKTSRRTLFKLCIEREASGVRIVVEGDGFLRKMVRILCGTLVEIGLRQRAADDIPRLLLSRDRALAGVTAPALPLLLEAVELRRSALAGALTLYQRPDAPFTPFA